MNSHSGADELVCIVFKNLLGSNEVYFLFDLSGNLEFPSPFAFPAQKSKCGLPAPGDLLWGLQGDKGLVPEGHCDLQGDILG